MLVYTSTAAIDVERGMFVGGCMLFSFNKLTQFIGVGNRYSTIFDIIKHAFGGFFRSYNQ